MYELGRTHWRSTEDGIKRALDCLYLGSERKGSAWVTGWTDTGDIHCLSWEPKRSELRAPTIAVLWPH